VYKVYNPLIFFPVQPTYNGDSNMKRTRPRPSPFGRRGTGIPGTEPRGGTYPIPSFGSPGVLNGLGSRPNPRLKGAQAPIGSLPGFAAAASGTFPANKKPRTGPLLGPGNHQSPMGATRGMTPSMILSAVTRANQSERTWETGDRTNDFLSIQRHVEANKGSLNYALALNGQVVFIDKESYNHDGNRRIFGRNNRQERFRHRGLGSQSFVFEGTYRLLSLPALNFVLRLDDTFHGGFGWNTPEKVLERYALDGVVRTDDTVSRKEALRGSNTKDYTVTIGKRDPDVTNIWGNLRQMQEVYVIIKRVETAVPNQYTVSPINDYKRSVDPRSTDAAGLPKYHPNPLQVVPWTDAFKGCPTADDLAYTEDGIVKHGIALRIGWANYASDATNSKAITEAWYNARRLMDLPRVDLTINIQRMRI